jgi:hypothetical protein
LRRGTAAAYKHAKECQSGDKKSVHNEWFLKFVNQEKLNKLSEDGNKN